MIIYYYGYMLVWLSHTFQLNVRVNVRVRRTCKNVLTSNVCSRWRSDPVRRL